MKLISGWYVFYAALVLINKNNAQKLFRLGLEQRLARLLRHDAKSKWANHLADVLFWLVNGRKNSVKYKSSDIKLKF